MAQSFKLKHMSIISQIRLTMIGMSLVMMLLGAVSLWAITSLQQMGEQRMSMHDKLTRPTANIALLALQSRRFEKDMFLNMQNTAVFESYLKKWTQVVNQLSETLGMYRDNCSGSKRILAAESWLADVNTYQDAVMTVVHMIQSQEVHTPQQANLAMAPHKTSVRAIISNSFKAFNDEFSNARQVDHNQYQQMDIIKSIMLGILVFVVVGCLGAMATIPHRIVNPLKSLSQGAIRLRDGDLSARVDANMPNNEIGELGSIFNEMAQQLQHREVQLQEACKNAESLNIAKTRFLMNMSHELRTPLTAILGFAEHLHSPELLDESAQIITRSGKHLLQIVDDLLLLTEIETGQFQVLGQQTSLITLIMEVAQELEPACTQKQLQLNLPDQTDIKHDIFTDSLRLKRVLHHLLCNAIKFTDEGTISIRCQKSEQEPCFIIEIQDTGKGMSPEQIKRVGQLFAMGDDSLTRSQGGLGTGLALSKQILEYMEGQLSITSQSGKGTTVTLTLPFHAQSIPAAQEDTSNIAPTSTRKTSAIARTSSSCTHPRVLIAEDTPDIQKLMYSLLKKANIESDLAENGQVAVEMALRSQLREQPYDLILMDMQMPVMDGYQATRHLRQHSYANLIVAVTAHALKEDRQKCLDAGCDDYIPKPIKPTLFVKYVQQTLEQINTPPPEVSLGAKQRVLTSGGQC